MSLLPVLLLLLLLLFLKTGRESVVGLIPAYCSARVPREASALHFTG